MHMGASVPSCKSLYVVVPSIYFKVKCIWAISYSVNIYLLIKPLCKRAITRLTYPFPWVSLSRGNFWTRARQMDVYSSEVGCVVFCHIPKAITVMISLLTVLVMTPSESAWVTRFENLAGSSYFWHNSPFLHSTLSGTSKGFKECVNVFT